MNLPHYIIPIKDLILSSNTGDWCKLPYPNHPRGCPNYGKDRCPPNAPLLEEYFDIQEHLYFVHSEFDLGAHALRMKEKHPNWTDRQCRCVLYWQGTSRKQLKDRIEEAVQLLDIDGISTCPEAMGINVFATGRKCGMILERTREISTCRHVAVVGRRKRAQR